MAHIFEHKGKSPFQCIGYHLMDGQGTGCDHCGTGIKHVFTIKSADGNIFEVGSSCVKKTGSKGLFNEANKIKRDTLRAEKNKIQQEKYENELQEQRKKNNGLTDYELQKEQKEVELEKRKEFLSPYANLLHDGKGGFRDSVAAKMISNGELPIRGGLYIMIEILAKYEGKKNSKAYEAEYAKLTNIFEDL